MLLISKDMDIVRGGDGSPLARTLRGYKYRDSCPRADSCGCRSSNLELPLVQKNKSREIAWNYMLLRSLTNIEYYIIRRSLNALEVRISSRYPWDCWYQHN